MVSVPQTFLFRLMTKSFFLRRQQGREDSQRNLFISLPIHESVKPYIYLEGLPFLITEVEMMGSLQRFQDQSWEGNFTFVYGDLSIQRDLKSELTSQYLIQDFE